MLQIDANYASKMEKIDHFTVGIIDNALQLVLFEQQGVFPFKFSLNAEMRRNFV